MTMPGQTGRSFDIIRQVVGNVVNIFNKRPVPCTAPCDGMILRMHYQWTFWAFLGCFSAIWYSWFHRDVITCASHYNAETQVRLDYINICLSYPFLKDAEGNRRYIMYYRWIHWSLLVMAAFYYIPRKISKSGENGRVKKLFEDLAIGSVRYDHHEKEQVERTARYLAYHMKTHNGLFSKYMICNFVALLIDLTCLHFFNFVFQGRFLSYGLQTYPFNRDVEHFTDYMSRTFPPFVLCELGETYKLTNKRNETLGCHLTVMELYEKVFFVLWVWLLVLTFMTVVYIVYLLCFWMSWARLHILRISKPRTAKDSKSKVRETVCKVIEECKIGDVYLLYRLRQHFSHARYYELLIRLTDPNWTKMLLDSVRIDHGNTGSLRHRPKNGKLPNSSILVD